LTYIIGAQCQDGIVLIGDTKISIGGGTDYSFAKKIINPSQGVVVGSSGSSGLYRTFQSRLILGIQEIAKEKGDDNVNWDEELVLLAERIIHDIADSYGTETTARNLDALIVIRTALEPELIHLTGRGYPEPITDYWAVGHGEPYGSVLLKTLWNKHKPMKMSDFAKIGCTAIRYVQDLELDNSVGIDQKKDGVPQVWYIPTIPQEEFNAIDEDEDSVELFKKYAIRELTDTEVKSLMYNTNGNIAVIRDTIENINLNSE
jgi:20S proteasome alpha/beta subunit